MRFPATAWRWAVVLVPALAIFFAPVPGFTPQQMHLLAIFAGTIIALVAQPVPMGVSVILAMTLLVLTQTLKADKVLAGFGNLTLWLIFSAFLFARAVTATGFGLRIAYAFISAFGRSTLSLGYCIAASDVVLAPFVPSDTARGGGVIFPITRSVAQAFHSEPGPSARLLGSYLMLVGFHATYTASAMFLTGMVANPIIAEFAKKIAHVDLTWMTWAIGSSVPGFLSLLLVPYLLFKLDKPEITDTTPARTLARAELARMGPLSRAERLLMFVMVAVMAGWISSPWHSVPNTFVALSGLSALLLLRVITWDDLLSERKAWDALIWFAPLLMMADQLGQLGVIKILSDSVFSHMQGWPWMLALAVLVIAYVYVHYGFASMTAHTTALYPGFLATALAAGAPPMLAALPLAYFSNLNAGITHYGTGSAPVYFGAGYVTQATWWKFGFLISVVNLVVWLGIGPLWWKLVGLW